MKLRQKLAMALAAAMVVTAVPVTTMAASTNSFNKTMVLMEEDVLDRTTNLNLNINIASSDESTPATFFVEAEDFEFIGRDEELLTADAFDGLDVQVLSKTELKVTTTGDLILPIMGKVTGKVPTIIIDGADSVVSSGKYPLVDGEVTDKVLTASVGDVERISVDGIGSIADITIQEVAAGRLNNKEVTIDLDGKSDLVFDYKEGDVVDFKGERGFAGLETTTGSAVTVVAVEDETMTVKFEGFDGQARGNVVLEGLKVAAENPREGVSEGEVKATIESEDNMEAVTAVVAEIKAFGAELTVEDDEAVEFIAGGEAKTVEITLAELAVGSFDEKHNVYFTVEGAEVIGFEAVEGFEAIEGLTYNEDDEEFIIDLDGLDETIINEFVIELELAAEVDAVEDITVIAESRNFDENLEVVVGTITRDRMITTEAAQVEVGIKGQIGGVVKLAEAEADTFEKNEILVLELEEEAIEDGVRIRDFELAVEGDLEVEKAYVTIDAEGNITEVDEDDAQNNVLAVKVTRASDEASTIVISEMEIDTNNATPEAAYNLVARGTLISEREETLEIEKFILVGDAALEEVEAEASFKVGSQSFELNGETITMDAAPYITKNDRVMVPVRYVSQAFGVEGDDILFSTEDGGTITLFVNGKVVQLVNGSNIANMNGVKIPMQETVTIKEGRTYIPMGEVARLLDVDVTWDNTTKTATFNN